MAGWFGKRSADSTDKAVSLARDGVTVAKVEHEEFLRQLRARARFSTYPPADLDAAQRFTSSDAAISRWFVEKMKEVHGIDFSQPPPPVNKVHDVQVSVTSGAGLSDNRRFLCRRRQRASAAPLR